MVFINTQQGETGERCGRRRTAVLAVLVFLASVWGCLPSPGQKPPQGVPDEPSPGLTGTWVRPISNRPESREGIRFDGDGRVGFIGIHSMSGLQWRLEGQVLVVTTATERYSEPFETRFAIQTLTGRHPGSGGR